MSPPLPPHSPKNNADQNGIEPKDASLDPSVRQRRTRILLAAIILVLGILVAIGIVRAVNSDEDTEATTSNTPSSTSAPPSSSSSPPSSEPAGEDSYKEGPVSPSVPTSLVMKDPDFTITADICQMDYILPLNPPGEQTHTACWVRNEFGVAPGTDSGGTSYIPGHAWAQQPLVFNPFSEKASQAVDYAHPGTARAIEGDSVPRLATTVLNNDTIELTTQTGRLTYEVTNTWLVPKEDAGNDYEIMDDTINNRIVLIACAVKDGQDLDYNVIVSATLKKSEVRET